MKKLPIPQYEILYPFLQKMAWLTVEAQNWRVLPKEMTLSAELGLSVVAHGSVRAHRGGYHS